jgi:hypothetical protein
MFQRNQISRGLIDCEDSDIIILEDLDEIVRHTAIPIIKGHVAPMNPQVTMTFFPPLKWKKIGNA